MEFNVNVNVKLSLDEKTFRLAELLAQSLRNCEAALTEEPVHKDFIARPPMSFEDIEKLALEGLKESPATVIHESALAKAEAAARAEKPSDLPFDNDANSEGGKPLPFVAIWMPEDARKARKKKMEEIEASVPADIKDDVHKQMVKVTKLYLNSAAYEHKRDEMGNALNTDGLPVKKLDELNSNETLRFMYLCEAMHFDADTQKVLPFENLDTVLGACKDWEQVEREFVKIYNKK